MVHQDIEKITLTLDDISQTHWGDRNFNIKTIFTIELTENWTFIEYFNQHQTNTQTLKQIKKKTQTLTLRCELWQRQKIFWPGGKEKINKFYIENKNGGQKTAKDRPRSQIIAPPATSLVKNRTEEKKNTCV